MVTDDSVFYGDIARCLIHNHGYGVQENGGWEPTVSRLPGYPLFLAFSFLLGGDQQYRTAMLLQLVFDMLSCLLVADIARRVVGERAARTAWVLAAFCPFLMNYVAAPLTECLEIFCICAALDCALIALQRRNLRFWMLCGISCAWAILLRPDGGLLLGCIGLPVAALGWRERSRRRELLTAIVLLASISLAPLVPWTIRNWRVFHIVQPLVAMGATNPGDYGSARPSSTPAVGSGLVSRRDPTIYSRSCPCAATPIPAGWHRRHEPRQVPAAHSALRRAYLAVGATPLVSQR